MTVLGILRHDLKTKNKKLELSCKSCTSVLWLNYIQYTSIIQPIIYSEREMNSKLHITGIKSMLNFSSAATTPRTVNNINGV